MDEQKSPCCLQDFAPFGAAAQKLRQKETRPDTRLPQSRAGGQGLYLRSLNHLGRSSEAKDRKKQQVAQGQYVVSDTRCPALHDREME